MKKLFIALLLLTGCATSSQKATSYCDANWKDRYDSWQSCYDRQYSSNENKRVLNHIGDGLVKSNNCSTWNGKTTCH